jgi:hypothetical protein
VRIVPARVCSRPKTKCNFLSPLTKRDKKKSRTTLSALTAAAHATFFGQAAVADVVIAGHSSGGNMRGLSMKSMSLSIMFAVAAGIGAFDIALAQPPSSEGVALDVSASDGRWTVLTLAPDGSWGAATESMSNRAIANAIAECKFKYRAEIGCGGYQVAVQQGWILGIRCGNENILAAARDLAEAERSVRREPASSCAARYGGVERPGGISLASERNRRSATSGPKGIHRRRLESVLRASRAETSWLLDD